MNKQKGWVSLATKLNILVMVIILAVSAGLTAVAYEVNRLRVDRYYMQTTSQAASAVAAFMDGDFFRDLYNAVESEQFQNLRDEAIDKEDEAMISDWLEKNGLLEQYTEARSTLATYCERLGAKFVYTLFVDKNISINLVDPDEDLLYLGGITISADAYGDIQTNQRIEPTVSTSDYGWLCSAYEPIVTSDGEIAALVGVDIDMNDVVRERHQFLIQMAMIAVGVMIVSGLVCMFSMRKVATKPLSMLRKATLGFTENKTEYTQNDVIYLPIRSKDEIGDLYSEIRSMQSNIVEYMDNLTRITAEKERIGAELNVATQIQADMLPRIFPFSDGRHEFELYATMTPAKEVGGDFYDFFFIDDDHLGLVMADVSGKGVPAALFMVIAKTLIKNRAQMGASPGEVLAYANEQLCEGNEAELFVTVWMAILEISTGKGVAVNAGHEHPAIRRKDGQFELVIYRHSPAVATMEGLRFREHSFQLNPGDSLFVYTDGVTEATNARSELYGTDRMLAALNRDPSASPEQLLINVKSDIDTFVGAAPQFDDITMLAIDYYGSKEGDDMDSLKVEATVGKLNDVLTFIDSHLEAADCPMKVQMQIDIAVEEIFVNIANYAYAPNVGEAEIRMKVDPETHEASIQFVDGGIPFDPLMKPDPDITLSAEERKVGGLGIYMVKQSMDKVSYQYKDGRNILTLKKVLY